MDIIKAYPMYPGLQTTKAHRPGRDGKHVASIRRQKAPPMSATRQVPKASLPDEVLEGIVDMLKALHGPDGCATCLMRDLSSLCLSSRSWLPAARRALYQDICLNAPQPQPNKKRPKTSPACRMALLRRTLRADAYLGALVRSLQLPNASGFWAMQPCAKTPLHQYQDSVAALVMACPNLEAVSGPVLSYDCRFSKLLHALSTRPRLKAINWLMQLPAATEQQPFADSGRFAEQHRRWSQLSSLSMHGELEAMPMSATLIPMTLAMLSSLCHLHLSNLPPDTFNDSHLLSLPRLHTLALSNMTGITCSGLSAFATCSNSQALRKLHLRHTPIASLPALARVLSKLDSLVTFSLVQPLPPMMPATDLFVLLMMPYLASATLSNLHWDMTSKHDTANTADDILARSIAAGGFPALRSLRAPNDQKGLFQNLCRPVHRIDLPSDHFRSLALPLSPTRCFSKPPTTSSASGTLSRAPSSSAGSAAPCTNLLAARLAAQSRIEDARHAHRFRVAVDDEDGRALHQFSFGGFIGTIGSPINYYLLPDQGSSDERGGLVDVSDLYVDTDEDSAGRGPCDGSWSRSEGTFTGKGDKGKHWHTKRARWTNVVLH
ncbi:hypothetical protein CDD82_1157 [Ophiocordyceps australis]|uniref:F-box domain-containing protein n=1 Tax=Ophiocordyceps australis TaxID=1399860 RepID=A0A2C5YJ72_9HYPO|nr:hypothetical protein CDD82_1157 [Ophiocordyceps australis]